VLIRFLARIRFWNQIFAPEETFFWRDFLRGTQIRKFGAAVRIGAGRLQDPSWQAQPMS